MEQRMKKPAAGAPDSDTDDEVVGGSGIKTAAERAREALKASEQVREVDRTVDCYSCCGSYLGPSDRDGSCDKYYR